MCPVPVTSPETVHHFFGVSLVFYLVIARSTAKKDALEGAGV